MTKTQNTKQYDLEERTARFGEDIIDFVKSILKDDINRPLINQIIRSATSIGANYMEANGASSRRDFRNKIHICQKETRETKHWLRMLVKSAPEKKDKARVLWKECQELALIFGKIISTLNKDNK